MHVIQDLYAATHTPQVVTCEACKSVLEIWPFDAQFSYEKGHHIVCPCCKETTPAPLSDAS